MCGGMCGRMCGVSPAQLPFSPRVLTITAIAQLVVLGCTWVFGLFIFNPRSLVLMYAFTILNCLQGFFLFLLHCLLNKKVGPGSSCGGPLPFPLPGMAPLTWHLGPCR